ncbi:MAG: hypothetical protein KF735_08050 [Chelatococcus sp.]|jgi:hypothetical protein|uniref:hypothetical protein n=1 Tax=unclassified Chelatococcus TaxID=2638111 RepID=UPI001BCD448E|nr:MULTISPECIES: hypothetical protein [unclassified Chelatococcus]CAH1671634.1 conserved hypothetical protein [Hyphomicrobiales bacterium]MBS7738487.1 hypothetical protein [Chelatococcus sp. HY11]MBX3537573.1 hypothetical protein [Chelatococcus sp.]MBX3542891.1 hypothetical protein [Chelatococcus sp.]MCO5076982.1 hypothetical protein [Chelatococcus sp.]
MVRLTNGKFDAFRSVSHGIAFEFRDFLTLRKRSREKPAFGDGRLFPTPNEVTVAWLTPRLRGDFAVESRAGGITQLVMLADEADAQALAQDLRLSFTPGGHQRCTYMARYEVTAFTQLKWATQAGLI